MASTQYTESVTLYSGCPFTPSNNWSLYPYDLSTKKAWFDREFPGAFVQSQIMHIKINTVSGTGVVRLEIPDNIVSGINYCYVNNSRAASYFAFVLGYEYINDGKVPGSSVYELALQKDVIMSAMDSTSNMVDTPIIRHHSTAMFDNPWAPEGFGAGTARKRNYQRIGVETNDCYAVIQYIQTSVDPVTNTDDVVITAGTSIGRVPQGCNLYYTYPEFYVAIHYIACDVARKSGNIAAVYLAPVCLFNQDPNLKPGSVYGASILEESDINKDTTVFYPTIDPASGSLRRNNKCYYYPYSFYRVYNDEGAITDLRYERWGKDGAGARALGIEGLPTPPVEVVLSPINYDGCDGRSPGPEVHYVHDTTHMLTMRNYPLGSWVNDTYSQLVGAGKIVDVFHGWDSFVRSAEHYGVNALAGLATTVGNVAINHQTAQFTREQNALTQINNITDETKTADAIRASVRGEMGARAIAKNSAKGAIAAAVMTEAIGQMSAIASADMAPDTLAGDTGSASSNYTNHHKYFYGANMGLTNEEYNKLDDYFDRYGYAQSGQLRTPDPFGRPRYCYIQTAGKVWNGANCNGIESEQIDAAFENGITLWHGNNSKSDIGAFSRIDNGPDFIPSPLADAVPL